MRHVVALAEVVLTLVLLPVFAVLQPLGLLIGWSPDGRSDAMAPLPRAPWKPLSDPRVRPMPAQHVSQARSGRPVSTFADAPIRPLPSRSYVR